MVLNYMGPNFIDGIVMEGQNAGWRLTGSYGEPSWDKRHLSWQYIRDLHNPSSLPWLVVGDFNEIVLCVEKEGAMIGQVL